MVGYYTFFVESFPQMCCGGKWLQNRLRADKNESRSLLVVDIQGYHREGLCIVPGYYITAMIYDMIRDDVV